LEKYGASPSRPQDDDKDFLLYRRKINFGVKEGWFGKSDVAEWNLSDLVIDYTGPIIKPMRNKLVFIEEGSAEHISTIMPILNDTTDIALDLEFNDTNSYLGKYTFESIPLNLLYFSIAPLNNIHACCSKGHYLR